MGSPLWAIVDHRSLDVFGAWLHRNTASGSDCFHITFRVSNDVAWKRTRPRSRGGITIHGFSDQTHLGAGGTGAELGSGSWSLVILIENQCSNPILKFQHQGWKPGVKVRTHYGNKSCIVIDELWTALDIFRHTLGIIIQKGYHPHRSSIES
ncbi:hypothetical protein Tco_0010490 [Tanacetum coccineum]